MPSLIGVAVAVAVAVGLVGELGRQLFSTGVGLLGATLLVTVP